MSIKISNKGIGKAIKSIQKTVKAAEIAQMRAVNRVAAKVRTAANQAIRKQVQLPAAYVNEALTITQMAAVEKPEAVISGRVRPARLARYGAKQMTVPVRNAKGDELRRILPGRRQAGVRVQVKPGRQKVLKKAFLVPLKRKNESQKVLMGVFTRTGPGDGDIKHHYGPSVAQVFQSVRRDIQPMIRRELASEYRRAFRFARSQ